LDNPRDNKEGVQVVELEHDHQHDAQGHDDGHQHHHQHSARGDGRSGRLRRIEIITGQERRRRWSSEEKAKITAESLEPGVKVAAVARRHGVSLGLLHSWRRNARDNSLSEPMRFVPVVTKAVEEKSAVTMIEIELADVRIRISGPVNSRNLGAILAAVRANG
jgi:transposase